MKSSNIKTVYKLGFGLLALSAIITEMATLLSEGVFDAANLFSYFTIQSNIIAIIILIFGALLAFAGKKSQRFEFFRGAGTFYMAVTGIVFAAMLSGLEGVRLTAVPWDNIVLHYIIPIVMVLDWVIDPPKRRIAFSRALLWLIYPLAYFAYSLIRGAIVNWYPYPFLNPVNGGYDTVLTLAGLITIIGVIGVFLLSRIGKTAAKR